MRVEEGADHSWTSEHLVVFDEEEVHHEADHLTGGEVLPCRLVREFREATDQLFVEVAHLDVGDGVRVKVDVGELRQDQVEKVVPGEARDLDIEVELVDYFAGTLAESGDVGPEVARDLGRVIEEAPEVEGRSVEEPLSGHALQDRIDILDLPLQRGEGVC